MSRWLLVCWLWVGCKSGGPAIDVLDDAQGPQVKDADLGADDLILNRLEAMIDTDASARDLERALAKVDGSIASSAQGVGWVTVTIPRVKSLKEINEVAETLGDTDGFVAAWPAWLVRAPEDVTSAERSAPPGGGGDSNPYLETQRFFGAWNAQALATHQTPVFVADVYTQNEPIPGLSAQRFTGPGPADEQKPGADNTYEGNHGFWVSSLLGADADAIIPSGTHPDPSATLDLVSLNYARSGSFLDILLMIYRETPKDGMFVLNTSFGFTDKAALPERYVDAIMWRELSAKRANPFLSLVASGNDSIRDRATVEEGSPLSLEANVATLSLGASKDPTGLTQRVFDAAIARTGPEMRRPVTISMLVGSSGLDGSESDFSDGPADIRMVGENMLGLCGLEDPPCVENQPCASRCDERFLKKADGTSAAAPVASGLAAWLFAIDPTLKATELRDLLLAHHNGQWVDAMNATLALEQRGIGVRKAILDVNDDGQFDDLDITDILAAFDAPERTPWARADLNGDGFSSADTRIGIDLDGDGVLGLITVQVPNDNTTVEDAAIDETQASDLDFLCWGAYAGPYADDPFSIEARDSLLRGRCGSVPAIVVLTIEASTYTEISVPVEFTGQPAYPGFSFSDFLSEGELVEDPDLVWTSVPPPGGFSLVENVSSFAYGNMYCAYPGFCTSGGLAYEGDASSGVDWSCSGSLEDGLASCGFSVQGSANALVSDGFGLPPYDIYRVSGAFTASRSTLDSYFRVDVPTYYQIITSRLDLPPMVGDLPPQAYITQDLWFELDYFEPQPDGTLRTEVLARQGRYGGADTTDGYPAGDLEGVLLPGIHQLSVGAYMEIRSGLDHSTGLSGDMDIDIVFTPL